MPLRVPLYHLLTNRCSQCLTNACSEEVKDERFGGESAPKDIRELELNDYIQCLVDGKPPLVVDNDM
eukprot:scaffold57_cov207-Alexandrium_tamarense.AAC.32